MTGKVERDLTQAQYTIDMLDMLKRRTEGNREESESKLLNRILAELQMNYVDEVKAEQKSAKPGEEDSQKAGSATGSESDEATDAAEKGGTPEEAGGKTETERSSS